MRRATRLRRQNGTKNIPGGLVWDEEQQRGERHGGKTENRAWRRQIPETTVGASPSRTPLHPRTCLWAKSASSHRVTSCPQPKNPVFPKIKLAMLYPTDAVDSTKNNRINPRALLLIVEKTPAHRYNVVSFPVTPSVDQPPRWKLTAPNVEEVEPICSLPRPAPPAAPRLANNPASAAAVVIASARVSSTCVARRPLLCASIACALYARLRFLSLRIDRPARRLKASSSNWTLAT